MFLQNVLELFFSNHFLTRDQIQGAVKHMIFLLTEATHISQRPQAVSTANHTLTLRKNLLIKRSDKTIEILMRVQSAQNCQAPPRNTLAR